MDLACETGIYSGDVCEVYYRKALTRVMDCLYGCRWYCLWCVRVRANMGSNQQHLDFPRTKLQGIVLLAISNGCVTVTEIINSMPSEKLARRTVTHALGIMRRFGWLRLESKGSFRGRECRWLIRMPKRWATELVPRAELAVAEKLDRRRVAAA